MEKPRRPSALANRGGRDDEWRGATAAGSLSDSGDRTWLSREPALATCGAHRQREATAVSPPSPQRMAKSATSRCRGLGLRSFMPSASSSSTRLSHAMGGLNQAGKHWLTGNFSPNSSLVVTIQGVLRQVLGQRSARAHGESNACLVWAWGCL